MTQAQHIVVVDDEQPAREMVGDYLRMHGFSVDLCDGGASLRKAIAQQMPDLIKLRFGYDSFTFHMSQVTAQGLPMRFFENEAIALDIDEPKDLQRFLSYNLFAAESTRVTRALLSEQETKPNRRCGGA